MYLKLVRTTILNKRVRLQSFDVSYGIVNFLSSYLSLRNRTLNRMKIDSRNEKTKYLLSIRCI